ncbi:unnamed protein product [Sympodiomycopsis kandeliae]
MSGQKLTLSQQLGLKEDPNKLDHTVSSHTGSKVTRFESGQPGFPTYHRRIANPVPLVFLCIGAFFLLYGFLLVEVRGLKNWHILLNIGLPLCGPGLMAGSMFAFAEGSTFLATFAGSFSGILAGYSLTFLPWTGIQAAYTSSGPYPQPSYQNSALNQADGVLWLVAMVPLVILFLGSLRTAIPISIAMLFVVLAFILQGVNLLYNGSIHIQYAAGALFIMGGVFSWYVALSVLLLEEGVKILPVFPLPRVD